ncbi:MAG TPA: hypothetical protein VGX92_01630 [Pyrinomonadaceae bacterium]|jgi:hypothetical protein|nr:hypothetical protein [Pyrinomonadaceae bacterium]
MPNVTVKIVGGKDKENLSAVTVGDKRWGENGASWGSSQSVPAGKETSIGAYYSGKRSAVATFDLGNNDVIIEITADGPGETGANIVDV